MGMTVTCDRKGCDKRTFGYWQTPDGRMFCEDHGPETKGAIRIGEAKRKAQLWGARSGQATRTYRVRGEGRTVKAKAKPKPKATDAAALKAKAEAKAETKRRRTVREAKAS